MELRFRTEHPAEWARPMESQLADQLSRINGLGLVRFDAECRQTLCRLKLFHPAGTNPVPLLQELKLVGAQLGFDHVAGAATMGEEGVPMSLLYLRMP